MQAIQKRVQEAISHIENALHITLEKVEGGKQQKNTYASHESGKHTKIESLTFNDIHFRDFDALEPVFRMVNKLTFIDCTIDSLEALRKLEYVNDLRLNNTDIPDVYRPDAEVLDAGIAHFRSVHFENMDIQHLSCLRPLSKSLAYISFKKCSIHHFSEVNLLPRIFSIHCTDSTVHSKSNDIQHKKAFIKWRTSLHLSNMELANFDAFRSIASHTNTLNLSQCQLESLSGILLFPKLSDLIIDNTTKVADTRTSENILKSSFQIEECTIQQFEIYEAGAMRKTNDVFDLEKLNNIAPCIKKLYCRTDKIGNASALQYFMRLEQLYFHQANADFNFFLPIAHQVKKLNVNEGFLLNIDQLSHYKHLVEVCLMDGYLVGKEVLPLQNLKRLLPLKRQLKKLELWEFGLKGLKCIEEFTALESLRIWGVSSDIAQRIFALPKIKRLSIDIENTKACAFNLKKLKQLEALNIQSDKKVTLKGLKKLRKLTWLEIEEGDIRIKNLDHLHNLAFLKCNDDININAFETMESLKRLELSLTDTYVLKGLEQFPNLEKLMISDAGKGSYLGRLDKLKVLYIIGDTIDSSDMFSKLPQLEKLEVCCKEFLPDISQLANLKLLDLNEVRFLKSIKELTKLKNLERISLDTIKTEEAPLFNKMPNLKQLNLSGYPIDKIGIKKKLNKPEILTLLGGPYLAFSVWKSKSFQL